MSQYSYLATHEDLMKSFTPNHLLNMEGYMVAWETNPDTLKKLLPTPLKPMDNVVQMYVSNILNPTLMPWYREASLAVKCSYENRPGCWTISLMLDGPGAEMGAYLGRERLNMPKKLVDAFEISRFGNMGKARIHRHGADLLNLTADINGKYNDPAAAEKFFANFQVGCKPPYNSFFLLYNNAVVDGKPAFINGRLVEFAIELDIKRWEPATVDIQLGETPDDPWAEIEVVKTLGGAYCLFDMYLNGASPLGEVADTEAAVLQAFKHRFDVSTYGGFSQIR